MNSQNKCFEISQFYFLYWVHLKFMNYLINIIYGLEENSSKPFSLEVNSINKTLNMKWKQKSFEFRVASHHPNQTSVTVLTPILFSVITLDIPPITPNSQFLPT